MNVKWYRDTTLIEEQDYTVDSAEYFCDTQVQAYNKIVITINNMTRANRFLKIFNIDDGIVRTFYNDELENIDLIEEITQNNQALNINEAELRILPKVNTGVLFQRTLPFSIYRNGELVGKFFVDTSTANSNKSLYKLKISDYISMLDGQTYLGGKYSNVTVANLVADILGDIPYDLDASLSSKTITGYLGIMSKREALREVAFSINAVIDTSRSEKIIIKPMPSAVSAEVGEDKILSFESTQQNIITEYEVNTTILTNTTEAADDIFSGTISGTQMIVFDSPRYSLSITGGSITASNINYAIITGNGAVTLKGKAYVEVVNSQSKTNPYAVSSDLQKVETYETTLICNEIDVLNLLSFVEFKIKSTFMMEDIQVGDLIELNEKECRVMSLEYSLEQTNIYATAELEAYYE